MAETVVGTSDPRAIQLYSVTLQSETERLNVFAKMMAGRKPTEFHALAKRERQQTTSGMPLVRIADLSKRRGDRVTCDMFHQISGKPFMGDKEMEGRGANISFDTMEAVINQTRFPINPGSRMTQQRTSHNLRAIARAEMASYFARLNDQLILVHLAGSRGTDSASDWIVPLDTDPDFAEILVNPVEPPTSNRYFCAGGKATPDLLDSSSPLILEDLDVISATLREMPYPPAPIRVDSDPMGQESPIWCLMVSERVWHYILSQVNSGRATFRQFLADAQMRRVQSKNHPLFTGDTGLWNGLLIKRMPRPIRFSPGDNIQITNSASGALADYQVPPSIPVDRSILLGAQALALVEGNGAPRGTSAFPMRWTEVLRDHGNSVEVGAGMMDGKKKFRFRGTDRQITDFGVAVIDSYAPDPRSSEGASLRRALSGRSMGG